ncbi:hypothetical protein OIO90_001787 [Microbotryomycetes sp. JL221]|nr:hypothetical protein OIO90_001787 [Microbotryomycetes sp. JL221]
MDDSGDASPIAGTSAASTSAVVKRVTAKRSQRACVVCRKLKKTCVPDPDGADLACSRCKKNGTTCVFDKPASNVVEDEGLSRLSTIEANLATQERRLDTIVSSLANMHEILGWVRSNNAVGGPATPHSHDAMHQALFHPPSSSSTTVGAVTAGGASVAVTGTQQALSTTGTSTLPIPNPPSLPLFSTTVLNPMSTTTKAHSDSASPAGSTSRLDALAHLAASPDSVGGNHASSSSTTHARVDRFASRLHAPIAALADAADQLQGTEDNATTAVGGESYETGIEGGTSGDTDEKPTSTKLKSATGQATATTRNNLATGANAADDRPKKRARIALSVALASTTPADKQFDVVAKGIISDRQARGLVLLWLKELQPFCSIIDPETSYSVLRTNTFRFNVLLYTAMRAQTGPGQPSKELISVAENVRDAVRHLIFDTAPQLETIQALAILACYHDEPYTLSGHALRLALSRRMENTFELIQEHGPQQTDDRAKYLTSQLRLWLYLVFLEFKHTRSTGRLILLRQEDVDFLDDNADKLLSLPHSIPDDRRTVANLKLTFVERRILLKARTFQPDGDIEARVLFFNQTRDLLLARHQTYDAKLAEYYQSPLDWRRRSQMRHYTESVMFLAANTFGPLLFERCTTDNEIRQIAQDALIAAQTTVRVVLHSPAYASSVKFCGYLFRVDLVFAALLMIKLARTFPNVVLPADVNADLTQLLELLSETAGSQRFSAILRHAKDQYLASIYDSSSTPNLNESSSSVNAPPHSQPSNQQQSTTIPPLSSIEQAPASSYSPSTFDLPTHSSSATATSGTGDVPPILPPWLASQLASPRHHHHHHPSPLPHLQQQQHQEQQRQLSNVLNPTSLTTFGAPSTSNLPFDTTTSNSNSTTLISSSMQGALLPGETSIDWFNLPREFYFTDLNSTNDLLDGNWLLNGGGFLMNSNLGGPSPEQQQQQQQQSNNGADGVESW